ncbi:hypothetical protein Bbelb_219980 [Branchiostoma belcheri]|nr:hypothetical protein Bbelb_219980 [Branchiostoma belcheri]
MAGCGCDVRACRSELRLDNVRLDFHNPYVFVKSQWSWHPAVFVTYRVIVAVYLAGVACFDGVYHGLSLDHRYKVLLYLPNLTFVLIAGYFALMATVTVFYNLPGSSYTSLLRRSLPWYLKLAWLLYNTTAATSVLVTVVHWTLVRETNQQTIDFVIDVNKYILNVAFLFIELIFSGVPVMKIEQFTFRVWTAIWTSPGQFFLRPEPVSNIKPRRTAPLPHDRDPHGFTEKPIQSNRRKNLPGLRKRAINLKEYRADFAFEESIQNMKLCANSGSHQALASTRFLHKTCSQGK